MRKLNRGIAAGILSLPLVLGATGIAAADSFEQHNAAVGPDGAASNSVQAGTDGSGGASYDQQQHVAGPDGAVSNGTSSSTGADDGLLGLGILGL
ncbi:hypothetical protein [Saccharopolyspora sp. SCSIO 74807]|uniref:hypothetical protein n=1 Tax=Saccharopolyspora sp. SCSIO 74807 TaxID=3118084 RepID=UPI0030D279F9